MQNEKPNYSFWTKYKKHAASELMLYVIMIVGIVLGIVIYSYFKD
jgi:hypothetical protein